MTQCKKTIQQQLTNMDKQMSFFFLDAGRIRNEQYGLSCVAKGFSSARSMILFYFLRIFSGSILQIKISRKRNEWPILLKINCYYLFSGLFERKIVRTSMSPVRNGLWLPLTLENQQHQFQPVRCKYKYQIKL